MDYRARPAPGPLLIGYDPFRDLPPDHLAWLVESVVEETVRPKPRRPGAGQPPYDPRLCVKALTLACATGVRSSRRMEQLCHESLPYLMLSRGDAPSYRTLCAARVGEGEYLEAVFAGLFAVAAGLGLSRLGRIVADSTRLRADASPEAVVRQAEFAAVQAELRRILAEAAAADLREDSEGDPGRTRLERTMPREHMREILRRVRARMKAAKPAKADGAASQAEPPPAPASDPAQAGLPLEGLPPPLEPGPGQAQEAAAAGMTPRMLGRVAAGLRAVNEAISEGRKDLCVTDPDARLMYGERERGFRQCHSYEAAVDNGLLVAGQSTQEVNDNARLEPLAAAAEGHEPGGVKAADGDSGYYAGDAVGRLLEAGVDVCVPDSNTAADLHRGRPIGATRSSTKGSVPFMYDAEADVCRCPEGNVLELSQERRQGGQERKAYRARDECRGCPLAEECLRGPGSKRRTLSVGAYAEALEAARQRFGEAETRERYNRRFDAIGTVFGFLRGTLGYRRWSVRGEKRVANEARLFNLAYQFRKVQSAKAAQAA